MADSSSRMNISPAMACSAKARRIPAIALELLGEQRHERRVESAFAEQRRNRLGKRKATTNASATGPVPRIAAMQNVAHEAENAAHQREATDGGEGAIELHARRAVAEPWPKGKRPDVARRHFTPRR